MTKQAARNAALVGAFGVIGALATRPADGRGNEELFLLDLTSGALKSRLAARETDTYLDSILLLNVSAANQPDLLARLNGREYRIPPGRYVAVETGGTLELFTELDQVKPVKKKIWGTDGHPAVYTLDHTGRGKIELVRGSNDHATAAALSAARGALRPAR